VRCCRSPEATVSSTKLRLSEIPVERKSISKCRRRDIIPAVVVEVSEIGAHARYGFAMEE
jgi:hypothetical protein